VAGLAIVAELMRNVIGIRGILIVGLVTRKTSGRSSGELPIHMACETSRSLMRSQQGKLRLGVVEGGRLPGISRMTFGAGVRELSLEVIGICGGGVIGLMTGKALGGRAGKLASHVALCAADVDVRAGQRKPGGGVINGGWLPRVSGVTLSASVVVVTGHVIRILHRLVICLVTGVTFRGCSRVLAVDMALRATHAYVRPGEGEAGEIVVILCRRPALGGVALRAVVIVIAGDVIRIRGAIIICLVT